MSKEWYVVRGQSGKEEQIKRTLEKNIKAKGAEELITRVIVPTEQVSEIRSGKKKIITRKLYPGYLMVEMELNDDTWMVVKNTPGIGDFLGLKKPTPMAKHEVEKVMMMESATSAEKKPIIKIKFKKGDNVRIKEGPFENFDGVVDEITPAKGIVKVIVTIFGRATPVDLEYWQIESI
ncbi:MAG: transcription termination/antitermination factor NusG [Planctomycetes bacterium]|nr:transcription termination/antitermination factor NusG [Planctomycetota bacterium]MCK5578163.1 transcription termination/antitermination factor NusG [Planctomycetota bacterium]